MGGSRGPHDPNHHSCLGPVSCCHHSRTSGALLRAGQATHSILRPSKSILKPSSFCKYFPNSRNSFLDSDRPLLSLGRDKKVCCQVSSFAQVYHSTHQLATGILSIHSISADGGILLTLVAAQSIQPLPLGSTLIRTRPSTRSGKISCSKTDRKNILSHRMHQLGWRSPGVELQAQEATVRGTQSEGPSSSSRRSSQSALCSYWLSSFLQEKAEWALPLML